MPRDFENYSISYALENIGDYFWRLYREDLKFFAENRNRTDIVERIHAEWNAAAKCKPNGTNIRIEWALAIYDHGDWEESLRIPVPPYKRSSNSMVAVDARRKHPAEYHCDSGVYVRSLSELCIANWLYANRIPFEYERKVYFPISRESAHCDFYLPDHGVYIEFWGMYKDPAYEQYKRWKEANYIRNKIRLVSLYPSDLKNLRDRLREALRQALKSTL